MKSPAKSAVPRIGPGCDFAAEAKRRSSALIAATLLPALLACGCSAFNRDWTKAASQPAPADSVEGRWEGKWISEVNHHKGGLRCLMTRESDERFTARFRATYGGIFHFSYTVPLTVQPHYGGWEFDGEADLGKMAGGAYFYEGRASPTNFFSTYRSKSDHGTFEMTRPR